MSSRRRGPIGFALEQVASYGSMAVFRCPGQRVFEPRTSGWVGDCKGGTPSGSIADRKPSSSGPRNEQALAACPTHSSDAPTGRKGLYLTNSLPLGFRRRDSVLCEPGYGAVGTWARRTTTSLSWLPEADGTE